MENELALKLFVKDAIANDYEDFETIAGEVTSWAAEAGFSTNPDAIFSMLKSLIELGLAQAYLLNSVGPLQTLPNMANPECYYLLTPKGREILNHPE